MDPSASLHLVRFRTTDRGRLTEAATRWLSSDEREHASQLRGADARARHVVGLALIRLLGAAAAGCEPRAVRIARTVDGKPLLAGTPQLHVSVSHSGGLVAAASSYAGPIGVDVESERRRDFEPQRLAARFFAEPEQAAFAAVERERAPHEFIRYWTVKEAVGKAIGHGIFPSLAGVVVDLSGDRVRLSSVAGGAEANSWTIHQLTAPDGVEVIAVALPISGVRLDTVVELGPAAIAAGRL
jgi:4'-phosphopantetheinyl transferase